MKAYRGTGTLEVPPLALPAPDLLAAGAQDAREMAAVKTVREIRKGVSEIGFTRAECRRLPRLRDEDLPAPGGDVPSKRPYFPKRRSRPWKSRSARRKSTRRKPGQYTSQK
ncbi:hypothetical protein GCM10008949_45340 [Deinococcus humi]|nr:hypothetical protein GCM10008949_45340 [Deinococcus humi]